MDFVMAGRVLAFSIAIACTRRTANVTAAAIKAADNASVVELLIVWLQRHFPIVAKALGITPRPGFFICARPIVGWAKVP
jgi:hypothetical protein